MILFKDDVPKDPIQRAQFEAARTFRALQAADAAREKAAKDAKEKAERDAELAELHRQSLADREKERAAAEKERLRIEREGIEESIKQRFFQANPAATASDFLKVKDELLSNYFLERAKEVGDAVATIKASGSYRAM